MTKVGDVVYTDCRATIEKILSEDGINHVYCQSIITGLPTRRFNFARCYTINDKIERNISQQMLEWASLGQQLMTMIISGEKTWCTAMFLKQDCKHRNASLHPHLYFHYFCLLRCTVNILIKLIMSMSQK